MRERFDGSIQSTNVPTYQNQTKREDYALYRCMVVKVLYVDDKDNITSNADNPEVLYDVIVLGGFSSGQVISNCRLASYFGGNENYDERILKASTKKLNEVRLNSHDGDVVYVQFLQGHSAYPVIVALDRGIKPANAASTKADGPRMQSEYNGLLREINNKGEYSVTRKGGSVENGAFKPNSESEYSWKVLEKEQVLEEFKSGLKITASGADDKYSIETAGGAVVEIDGAGGKITISKGSTVIELDGNSDTIALKGGFVELGSSVSDFAVLFTELLTTFNSHSHAFTDITPGGPVPSVTQPPLAPMLASVGSSTVKVQP